MSLKSSMGIFSKQWWSVRKLLLIGGVGLLAVTWHQGTQIGQQAKATDKAAMTRDFRLDAEQVAVYDHCVSILSPKKFRILTPKNLRFGGASNAEFCGCFANAARTDLPATAFRNSAANLEAIFSNITTNSDKDFAALLPLAQTAEVVRKCADALKREVVRYGDDDGRSAWTSQGELAQWCAAKNERTHTPICKYGLPQTP
jgi:hypothetical protein